MGAYQIHCHYAFVKPCKQQYTGHSPFHYSKNLENVIMHVPKTHNCIMNHKCTQESVFLGLILSFLWWVALVNTLLGLSVGLVGSQYQNQPPHLLQLHLGVWSSVYMFFMVLYIILRH